MIDVARAAGVSLGTVSNVLNHPDRVSPPMRERVQTAIADLGFVRNEAARQLRAGTSRMVGLVVLDVANPFFTDMAAGAEQSAEQDGLSVVLCNSAERADREQHYLTLLEEQRVYGVLLTPAAGYNRRIADVRRRGTPVVLMDHRAGRQACSVSVDDVAGGALAVRHLLERGHQRISFVGGPLNLKQVADRLAGGRAAMAEAGRSADDLVVVPTPAANAAGGRQAGVTLAAHPRRTRPTAAVCANDLLALGLLQEASRHGIEVPRDLALVGYDDIEFARTASVPLTSVRQPRDDLGRTAMQLLVDEVTAPQTHRHRQVVFTPTLVVRASSGRPPVVGC